jgi:hypothetical protein
MEKLKSFDPTEEATTPLSPETVNVMRQWYKVHKIAAENPRILLKYYGNIGDCRKATDICAKRMKDCEEADKNLFALNHPFVTIFKNNQIPDCRCTIQSNPKKKHPECKEQIKDYFAYREALMLFVFERYIKNTDFMYEENLMLMEAEKAEDLTEIVLTKLSGTPVIGNALESISNEAYDNVEQNLIDAIQERL